MSRDIESSIAYCMNIKTKNQYNLITNYLNNNNNNNNSNNTSLMIQKLSHINHNNSSPNTMKCSNVYQEPKLEQDQEPEEEQEQDPEQEQEQPNMTLLSYKINSPMKDNNDMIYTIQDIKIDNVNNTTNINYNNQSVSMNNIVSSRLDCSYFERRLHKRTGFPTIIAKERNTMNISNWENLPNIENDKPTDGYSNNKIDAPLMVEIEKIEKQAALKMKMETFILYFNKDYQEGIKYLIDSNMLDEKPNKIAYLMLTTEGLSKEMIGKCLGSHEEKNKAILQAYCELLDLRDLEFDKALRLLLSTFKLPGEAQQIERIVRTFAIVYHKDNPNEFDNEETPFILAYSLLMLNTDAHSDKIQPKNKMTKQQFVNNNIRVCPSINKEYLERMYDNIVKEKFETKIDYIESVYNRLHVGHFDLQGLSLKNAMSLAAQLSKGCIFIKYGRRGNPHQRLVWISEKDEVLYWRNVNKSRDKPRELHFMDIQDIMVGCNTTQVLRKYNIPEENDPLFFSLITPKRTLDLKAPDVQTRIKWEQFFRLLLTNKKQKFPFKNHNNQIQKIQEKQILSEIWKTEILANWEFHWDYENGKPKGVKLPQKMKISPAKKPNHKFFGNDITIATATTTRTSKIKKQQTLILNASEDKIHEMATGDSSQREVLNDYYFKGLLKNKNTLLISIWKQGIPDWLKKVLWPMMIQNKLEITLNLYNISVEKIKQVEQGDLKNTFNCIEKDLLTTISSDYEILQDPCKKQSLTNILQAFIIYRPDIGYAKGMCNLASTLLLYLSEYETFNCFINLIHSHHFLSFFKGDLREIEWRMTLFNKYFKEELPFLFNHFKALDLTSDMYILDWFITLFSMNLADIDIISRIWDCFFLEGEIFIIKVGIGILKYFESELRMLTFDGAIRFLKKFPNTIDEDTFFDIINNINISELDYQKVIQAQKKAKYTLNDSDDKDDNNDRQGSEQGEEAKKEEYNIHQAY